MALVNGRAGIGGRKPVQVDNPFVFEIDGDTDNMLYHADIERNISLEDLIIGCVRSFTADKTTRQDFVNWRKVIGVYRDVEVITRQGVQEYLSCSESQAKRYIRVIKMTNMFIPKWMSSMDSLPKRYIHIETR